MRKLAIISFSFAGAVFAAQYAVPTGWLLPMAACFVVLGLASLFIDGERKLLSLLLAFGFAAGLLWDFAFFELVYRPFASLDGQRTEIYAEVADYPQETAYGFSLYIKLEVEGSPLRAKTLLYADERASDLKPGDIIRCDAEIVFSDTAYGEESDYYLSRGVFLLAYQKGALSLERAERLLHAYYPAYFSLRLKEKISQIYSEDTTPFLRALLSGDRSMLNRDAALTSDMSTAGITHVVAVSGMHISFLLGFILVFTRRRRLSAFIGIPVIIVFMAMMGFRPSVVRAGIMQIFLLAAPLFRRENDPVTSLGAVLMLLLAVNPCAAKDIGLQLSFAAISGIMLFSGSLGAWLLKMTRKLRFFRRKWAETIAVALIACLSSTLGALVFTTPLVALYFNYVSLIAPLTNILLLWAVSLSFCLGFVSVLLGFIFTPFGVTAAWLVSWIVRYIASVVKLLADIPYAALYLRSIFIRVWLIYAWAVLGFLLLSKKKRRPILPLSTVIIALCAAILLSGVIADSTALSVTAVDVGQGQCIVLTGTEHTVVVDCGGNGESNVGNSAVEYLMSINRPTVDILIITHFHSDHVDGVVQLMNRVSVGALAVPAIDDGWNYDADYLEYYEEITALAESRETDIIYVTEDIDIFYQDLMLRLFAPIGSRSENERGVVVLCGTGESEALITGDIDDMLERRLVMSKTLPDIEVLIVGHHGSKYSTCEALLDAVTPETAIVSVGYNSYGHPSDEVLSRLKDAGINVYRTDISGTVTVRLS